MREKNYYEILGVERTAHDYDIRAAFRVLAKKYHPDLSGSEGTRRFQEILKAYSVLSDPKARVCYDRNLRMSEEQERVRVRTWQPAPGTATIVSQHRGPHRKALNARFPQRRDTLELSFRDHAGFRKIQGDAPVHVEVLLSRKEARQGGILPLLDAGVVECPSCRGAGGKVLLRCPICHGRGVWENEKPVLIRIPAGARDGWILEVPIQSSGNEITSLRILVRVIDTTGHYGFL